HHPDERQWMQKVLDECIAELSAAGLASSSMLIEGDPKHVLIDQAKNWSADCIFVGARGLSRVERFLLGSVSTAVAMRADCSVEIVRFAT
ncbi:MAG: universal stress protein, partial [Tepidisphaeraceae bacterium]